MRASQEFVAQLQKRISDPNELNYDLQIEESNPTQDQFATIKSLTPLLAKTKDPKDMPRPTLVSWFNGKVAVANLERANAILNLANEPSKSD